MQKTGMQKSMQKTGMQKSGLHTAIKIAIGSTIVATSAAQAAGLEYTKQSILPFFEEGNYAELSSGQSHYKTLPNRTCSR